MAEVVGTLRWHVVQSHPQAIAELGQPEAMLYAGDDEFAITWELGDAQTRALVNDALVRSLFVAAKAYHALGGAPEQ
jgi:hypothetical protein